ncbi:hypothetical protein T440DRAFT_144840 [Plenodomus tracheiphilus IPT5]|uniref:Uncharacterized protein n=1 Tax=Plenodomus tracheiphilus IPT5 TaxID=1408161 RepID=A0A6A7B3P4_9PLEO|nr:hypothetical protein T440DRAFT_144840 [Plenodomus tracheiphilus IPT5]
MIPLWKSRIAVVIPAQRHPASLEAHSIWRKCCDRRSQASRNGRCGRTERHAGFERVRPNIGCGGLSTRRNRALCLVGWFGNDCSCSLHHIA